MTAAQREAVIHDAGPLLIIAGAGTGKTTVITRRIAWLLATRRAEPQDILALTFTDKAASEMEERVDLLVPYGYTDIALRTFHAFGDEVLRGHALDAGLEPHARVLSKAEQLVFLRQHIFDLPLNRFRPLQDPARYVEALAAVFSRAKDEAVGPEEFLAYAETLESSPDAQRLRELAGAYAAYQGLMRREGLMDFGDQVFLTVQLFERHPEIVDDLRRRFRYILVDEFQDTNYAQFRLLQLLAPPDGNVTVVADDDQSIYKWRGAAISNVLKFLETYPSVTTVVLTENFRSNQPILDCAYRLIRFNDPDRLEVHKGIDKRLIARGDPGGQGPHMRVFDTVSSEADWVAQTIRAAVESGRRRAGDVAILVRSNKEADVFLRALNVAGLPWQFSGASGLFARQECKMLISCLKVLADPEDSISWYHVASSALYRIPMKDLVALLAQTSRTKQSFRAVLADSPTAGGAALLEDVDRLLELSRTLSPGQLLYRWLADRGILAQLARGDEPQTASQLQTFARFFDQLRRVEALVGPRLPDVMQHLDVFLAMGQEPFESDDAWADCVNVLTIHKAKGLEFPVVFMVGLVQSRFPTVQRRDPIELPEPLIKDILPAGNYHLQEERRLFYVGMTRAKSELSFTCAYSYGGKTVRKVSQFVLEALDLASPNPPAKAATARELIERSRVQEPLRQTARHTLRPLRLDPHGADDYLTCPLKYRYSHVLKIPIMRHHAVIYGSALHKAIEAYFTRRLRDQAMTEQELLEVFERHWISEGFLTREHEDLRLAQGRETLSRFFTRQQARPEQPTLIEEKFKFPLDGFVVSGRWDRVDVRGEEAVIIDYKSTDVHEQAAADRRTRESFQLLIYALAWHTLHGVLPERVELHFLETDLVGQARFDEEDLDKARTLLRQVAAGVQAREFRATPDEHACRWCAFQAICPFAFQSP